MTVDKEGRKLLSDLEPLPVSKALARAMRLAQERGDEGFARWCRLDSKGTQQETP